MKNPNPSTLKLYICELLDVDICLTLNEFNSIPDIEEYSFPLINVRIHSVMCSEIDESLNKDYV